MSYIIDLHPKALEELNNSYQWYEARSEGLGKRFLTCVEKRINEIAKHPERYPKKNFNLEKQV
jgi:ParE toxin of type II toxin-antitoxin system, parDE